MGNVWVLVLLCVGSVLFTGLVFFVGFRRGRQSVIEELQAEVLEWVVDSHLIFKGDEDGFHDDSDALHLKSTKTDSEEK